MSFGVDVRLLRRSVKPDVSNVRFQMSEETMSVQRKKIPNVRSGLPFWSLVNMGTEIQKSGACPGERGSPNLSAGCESLAVSPFSVFQGVFIPFINSV